MTVSHPTVVKNGLKIAATVAVNAILDEDTLSSDSNEALATQQSIKAYVDSVSSGYNRRAMALDYVDCTAAPPTEVSGDRYVLDYTVGTLHAEWDGAAKGDIVEFNGTTWDATTPNEGWVLYIDDDNKDLLHTDDGGADWEFRNVAISNHNDLSNIDGGTSGQYYHLTSAQHTDLTDSGDCSIHQHDDRYYTESEVDALLPEDGTAAGQTLFWNGSGWKHTETSELYWDDTNKRLSVGAVNTAISYPGMVSALNNMGIHSIGTSNSWGAVPEFIFLRGRGSLGSVTAPLSGDVLGEVVFAGMWNDANLISGAKIVGYAAENYSSSLSGTDMVFQTTPIGASNPTEKLRIEDDGAILFPDMTAPGTTTNRLYNTTTGLYFDGTRLDIDASGFVDTSGTPANDQIAVFTDANTIEGNDNFKINSDGNVSVGDVAHLLSTEHYAGHLIVNNSVGTQAVTTSSNLWDSAQYILYKSRGTVSSPTAALSGDLLGSISWGSMWSSSYAIHGASIRAYAAENFASNLSGTDLVFFTTTIGASPPTEKLRIEDDGALLFPDMTAPGTTTNRLYNTSTGLYFDGTRLDVAAGETNNVEDGTAAGQLVFWDGSSEYKHTETSELVWDDTNKRFGFGGASDLGIMISSESEAFFTITGYGIEYSQVARRNANGTMASPTASTNGERLGSDSYQGYYNGNWREAARVDVFANSATMAAYIPGRYRITTYGSAAEGGTWDFDHEGAITFKDVTAPSTTTNKLYNTTTGLYFDGTRLDVSGVDVSGTPVDNQIAVWTDADTLEGTTSLTFVDGSLKIAGATRKVYSDSANLTIATETSGDLSLNSAGEILFDDGNISGWTQGYMKFSNASSEWTEFETNFGGEVSLLNAINQAYEAGTKSVENTDIDIGTETIDSFADTVAKGATWSYIISSGTNYRAGIVVAVWDATNDTYEYNDIATDDIGDTSAVTLLVDISTDTVRFRATVTSDNWNVQAERKLIARA